MWLNKDNYKEYLKGISIVEVSGESCANCLTLMPLLDKIVKERNDCKLFHIEANEDTMELIEKYEIRQVPTIMIMYNDSCFVSCRGFQPEEILELWIDSKIKELKKINNISN